MPTTYYRINRPAVIGEIIDDEAIVVNLDNGAYYSLRESASLIWYLLEQNAAPTQMSDLLAGHFQIPAAQAVSQVDAFLAELATDALIVPTDVVKLPVASLPQAISFAYHPPVLEKFTDMADLLLLDPIHEVDEAAGWPQPASIKR